jgi:hypothetical protein
MKPLRHQITFWQAVMVITATLACSSLMKSCGCSGPEQSSVDNPWPERASLETTVPVSPFPNHITFNEVR